MEFKITGEITNYLEGADLTLDADNNLITSKSLEITDSQGCHDWVAIDFKHTYYKESGKLILLEDCDNCILLLLLYEKVIIKGTIHNTTYGYVPLARVIERIRKEE